jgi:hypothetical protein
MTTGRGIAGAAGGAAGLRAAGFLLAAGLRLTAFFFAAFFFPVRLFAFAIRSSSQVTPGGGLWILRVPSMMKRPLRAGAVLARGHSRVPLLPQHLPRVAKTVIAQRVFHRAGAL